MTNRPQQPRDRFGLHAGHYQAADLRYSHGLNLDDIAAELGYSRGTVIVWLQEHEQRTLLDGRPEVTV